MNLELFPCSGGMAEGFRRAGITFDLAFDAWPEACASYEANLGHRPVCGGAQHRRLAVVLSERAATILQGFPETWRFLSPTKTGRWSMLGQAMPPPLAEAVARAVREQMERAARGEAA